MSILSVAPPPARATGGDEPVSARRRGRGAGRLNPASLAVAAVLLAAFVALLLLVLTTPSRAGSPKLPRLPGVKPQLAALTVENGGAAAPLAAAEPGARSKTLKVRRGDTLMKVLTKAGADRRESYAAITALAEVFDPRRLKAGQEVTVTFADDAEAGGPRLVALRVVEDVEREVAARRRADRFVGEEIVRELAGRDVRAAGTIDANLYQSARRAGLPARVIIDLIRIFSFDVDFQREVRPGDRFEVLFERFVDDEGRPVKDGEILFAAMTLSGTKLEFYRYVPSDGTGADYFDAKGRSVRKSLIRTPIDGARLTSRFGRRRLPSLGYRRMHRGTDFGAPTGTPIMAAGDGVVVRASRFGGYGKYIRIRHNSSYSTAYAHLSRFARGLRKGRRVKQGQIIGYVGSTGRTTGPHLHYEVLVDGRQVNPLKVRLPTGHRLKGDELARFNGMRAEIETRVAAAPMVLEVADRGADD